MSVQIPAICPHCSCFLLDAGQNQRARIVTGPSQPLGSIPPQPPDSAKHPAYIRASDKQHPLANLPEPKPVVKLPGMPELATLTSGLEPSVLDSSPGWQDKFNDLFEGKTSDLPAEKEKLDVAEFSVPKAPFLVAAPSVQPLPTTSISLPGRKKEVEIIGNNGKMRGSKARMAIGAKAVSTSDIGSSSASIMSSFSTPSIMSEADRLQEKSEIRSEEADKIRNNEETIDSKAGTSIEGEPPSTSDLGSSSGSSISTPAVTSEADKIGKNVEMIRSKDGMSIVDESLSTDPEAGSLSGSIMTPVLIQSATSRADLLQEKSEKRQMTRPDRAPREEELSKLGRMKATVSIPTDVSEAIRQKKKIDGKDQKERLVHAAQEVRSESVIKCADKKSEGSNDGGAAIFVRLIGMESGKAIFKIGHGSSSGPAMVTVSLPTDVSEAIRLKKKSDRSEENGRLSRAAQEVRPESITKFEDKESGGIDDAGIFIRLIGMEAGKRLYKRSDDIDQTRGLSRALQEVQCESAAKCEAKEREASDDVDAMNFVKLIGMDAGKSKFFYKSNGLLENRTR